MADNPFDPPNIAYPPLGPPPERKFLTHPDVEDRRWQDFGDWEGGRWLDPTSFQYVKDEAWRMPPWGYTADLPVKPLTPMGRELGGEALDRANAAMQALRQGLEARKQK